MKSFWKIFFLLICLGLTNISGVEAQSVVTRIFNPKFRTLKVSSPDNFMGIPVIRLGTDDRLDFNFDELGEENSYLQYRLLHCNYDWTVSQLLESEYLQGFNYADIEDYGFSSNTYVHYVNYNITIPNAKISPLLSGNYILQVYNPDDPDIVILQAGFCVSENAFPLGAEVSSRTDRGLNTIWQQVNVKLSLNDYKIYNPYSDLILVVNQNGMPSTTKVIKTPQRVSGNLVVYEHIQDLIFPASNEFRRFETVRTNYPGMGVDANTFEGNNYHAILYQDESRAYTPYSYDRTQRGRFKIDEYNSTDPLLGADYVTVHFSLHHPEVMDADIYVDGEFTNHLYNSTTRMRYNTLTQSYELEMPLKQGSYNYQYVAVPHEKSAANADPSLMEGNKFETQNEYQIFVYYRQPGARFDKLLSTAQIFLTN